jgi:hypothetical protein
VVNFYNAGVVTRSRRTGSRCANFYNAGVVTHDRRIGSRGFNVAHDFDPLSAKILPILLKIYVMINFSLSN